MFVFNNTYRYLDDIFYVIKYTTEIYLKGLTLNKANNIALNANFWCIFLKVYFPPKFQYDKRSDFSSPIVNYPFSDVEVPLASSCCVYIAQLVRYARVSEAVTFQILMNAISE